MPDGTDRTDVAYVWPRTLRHPSRPPKPVYLDLNHWILLAKASTERPDGMSHRPASRQTVLFSGAPGSGKTTMLSCCAAELDPALRVVVAEEVFEADIPLANV